jgi:hypothetical protein
MNTTTKEETLAEFKRIRDLYHAMNCGKQLMSVDDFAQAFEHAAKIAKERNLLQIMTGHYQCYLDNEMLSDDELKLAHMYEEEGVSENHQHYMEGKVFSAETGSHPSWSSLLHFYLFLVHLYGVVDSIHVDLSTALVFCRCATTFYATIYIHNMQENNTKLPLIYHTVAFST